MEKLMGFVILMAAIIGLSMLFAYPTMWAVNYLFASSFLTFVFGTAKISFWQALVLNFLMMRGSNSKSKD